MNKIDWEIVEKGEAHGPFYFEVSLEGTDELGNKYIAWGYADYSDTVGGRIEDINDIEQWEE